MGAEVAVHVARVLTPAQLQRLAALRRVAWALDSAFRLPGTQYRVGLDPIIGLVPGLGDALPALFSVALLWEAYRLGIPRVVQLRMAFNAAIDGVLGFVPVAGDLADLAFKASARNLALLEQHAFEVRPASRGDIVFVVAVIASLLLLALAPILLFVWMVRALAGGI
jgi:hypothetical protein